MLMWPLFHWEIIGRVKIHTLWIQGLCLNSFSHTTPEWMIMKPHLIPTDTVASQWTDATHTHNCFPKLSTLVRLVLWYIPCMQYIMFLYNGILFIKLNKKQYIMSSKYIIFSSQESVGFFFFFGPHCRPVLCTVPFSGDLFKITF